MADPPKPKPPSEWDDETREMLGLLSNAAEQEFRDKHPDPRNAEPRKPTEDEVLSIMHADDVNFWRSGSGRPEQRKEFWKFWEAKWYEGQATLPESDRAQSEPSRPSESQPKPWPLRDIKPPKPKHPSTLRAILEFLRRWAAVGGVFLLGACWTMIQIDEYALALILLVIGMGAFSIQIYDWNGIENHRKATRVLKGVAVVLIVSSLAFFAAVIVKKKGTKPWSNLLAKETRPEIAKQAFPSPSVATSPLLARVTPSPITTPSRSPQSLPLIGSSTPPIVENNITDFRVIRDVGRSVAVEAWYVYSGTAGTENILVTAQVLQADGGGVSVSATDSPVIAVNTKAFVEIWFNYQPIKEGDTVTSTSIELCMIQQTKGAFYCRKFLFKKVWK